MNELNIYIYGIFYILLIFHVFLFHNMKISGTMKLINLKIISLDLNKSNQHYSY